MTPEKFRQWIVILFAVSIATLWVGMGLKMSKFCRMHDEKFGMGKAMMKQQGPMPIVQPRRGALMPTAPAKPTAAKPALPPAPTATTTQQAK